MGLNQVAGNEYDVDMFGVRNHIRTPSHIQRSSPAVHLLSETEEGKIMPKDEACQEVRRTDRPIQAPKPHKHTSHFTPDAKLFEEYHTGMPIIDASHWTLTINGLVEHPLLLSRVDFQNCLPSTITAFHGKSPTSSGPASHSAHS